MTVNALKTSLRTVLQEASLTKFNANAYLPALPASPIGAGWWLQKFDCNICSCKCLIHVRNRNRKPPDEALDFRSDSSSGKTSSASSYNNADSNQLQYNILAYASGYFNQLHNKFKESDNINSTETVTNRSNSSEHVLEHEL